MNQRIVRLGGAGEGSGRALVRMFKGLAGDGVQAAWLRSKLTLERPASFGVLSMQLMLQLYTLHVHIYSTRRVSCPLLACGMYTV